MRTIAGSSRESCTDIDAGIAWRDLPREHFGPWQTVWKRHRRYDADGTLDRVLSEADAAGDIGWNISIDGTINRAHQQASNTTRPDQDTGGLRRITRICAIRIVNQPDMASVSHAVD